MESDIGGMIFKFSAELKVFFNYLCFLQSFSLFDCFLELYFKQTMISFIISNFLLISWNLISNFIDILSNCLLLTFCFTSKLLLPIQSFWIFNQRYCTTSWGNLSSLVVSIVFASIANLFLMYCFNFRLLILFILSKYFYVDFLSSR